MSTVTAEKLAVGDIVYPKAGIGWPRDVVGRPFVVTKVPTRSNAVNYFLSACDDEGNLIPGGCQLKGRPGGFSTSKFTSTSVEYEPNPAVGALVRPDADSGIPAGVYVVIGETDERRVRIMLLGGDNGRYWRAYSRSLTVIKADAATAALEAAGL